jgi:hypothetical protein
MINETTTERIERAANHIEATKVDDENYVYYADEVQDWYLVEAASLDGLGILLEADDDDVRRDAYSHWCSGPDAGEPLDVGLGDITDAIEAAVEVIDEEETNIESVEVGSVSVLRHGDVCYEGPFEEDGVPHPFVRVLDDGWPEVVPLDTNGYSYTHRGEAYRSLVDALITKHV